MGISLRSTIRSAVIQPAREVPFFCEPAALTSSSICREEEERDKRIMEVRKEGERERGRSSRIRGKERGMQEEEDN